MDTDRTNDTRMQKSAAASRGGGITGASALFSVAIILLITLGYRVQTRSFNSGILITEFGIILLPALLYVLVTKPTAKELLRLNTPKAVNLPIVFGIMIFAVPLAAVFNLINLAVVNSIFGRIAVDTVPVAHNGTELLVNIFVIAVSAGICEEFLFRGVIQGTFGKFGTAKSIILAAFLFSITHLDFQKILGTFVLGALIGYIVYRTDSLYCGMFAHFTNNALAVFAGYVSDKMLQFLDKTGAEVQAADAGRLFDVFKNIDTQQLVFAIMIYGFILIFAAIVFVLLLYLLAKVNPVRNESKPLPAEAQKSNRHISGRKGLLLLLPGFVAAGLWFFTETCSFLGIQNTVTTVFRQIIGA